MELLGDKGEHSITNFKDPFKADKVDKIRFEIERTWFGKKEIEYKASIRFKNGNTSGYHDIKSADLESLIKDTEYFIKSL